MELNESGFARREKMAGRTIAAVVMIWIVTAVMLMATVFSWMDYRARIEHRQDPADEMAVAIVATITAAAILAAAVGIHMRMRWARMVGLAFCVLSGLGSVLTLFIAGPFAVIPIGIYTALFILLVSEPTNEWCDR